MVIRLIPFSSADNFKHVRKMAMVEITAPTTTATTQQGFGSTPIGYSFPTRNASQIEKTQFYNDYLQNAAVQSELQKPIEEKIITGLSREIIDILQNPAKNDDARVYDYMNAIKRYLYYRNKTYNITPVASISGRKQQQQQPKQKKHVRIQDYSKGISPQEKFKRRAPVRNRSRNQLFLENDSDDDYGSGGEAAAAGTPPGARPGGSPRSGELNSDGDHYRSPKLVANDGEDSFDLGDFDAENLNADEDGEDEDDYLINVDKQRALKIADIVRNVAPPLKPKVSSLLKKVIDKVDRKELGWNENNEPIINGLLVTGVSLGQLLQNVLVKNKSRKTDLKGFPDIVNVLLSNNIITEKLGNELLQFGKGNSGGSSRIRNWEI
jgi:hypothetical protein